MLGCYIHIDLSGFFSDRWYDNAEWCFVKRLMRYGCGDVRKHEIKRCEWVHEVGFLLRFECAARWSGVRIRRGKDLGNESGYSYTDTGVAEGIAGSGGEGVMRVCGRFVLHVACGRYEGTCSMQYSPNATKPCLLALLNAVLCPPIYNALSMLLFWAAVHICLSRCGILRVGNQENSRYSSLRILRFAYETLVRTDHYPASASAFISLFHYIVRSFVRSSTHLSVHLRLLNLIRNIVQMPAAHAARTALPAQVAIRLEVVAARERLGDVLRRVDELYRVSLTSYRLPRVMDAYLERQVEVLRRKPLLLRRLVDRKRPSRIRL